MKKTLLFILVGCIANIQLLAQGQPQKEAPEVAIERGDCTISGNQVTCSCNTPMTLIREFDNSHVQGIIYPYSYIYSCPNDGKKATIKSKKRIGKNNQTVKSKPATCPNCSSESPYFIKMEGDATTLWIWVKCRICNGTKFVGKDPCYCSKEKTDEIIKPGYMMDTYKPRVYHCTKCKEYYSTDLKPLKTRHYNNRDFLD